MIIKVILLGTFNHINILGYTWYTLGRLSGLYAYCRALEDYYITMGCEYLVSNKKDIYKVGNLSPLIS